MSKHGSMLAYLHTEMKGTFDFGAASLIESSTSLHVVPSQPLLQALLQANFRLCFRLFSRLYSRLYSMICSRLCSRLCSSLCSRFSSPPVLRALIQTMFQALLHALFQAFLPLGSGPSTAPGYAERSTSGSSRLYPGLLRASN